jgi:ABC-type branched-subunit amino acid transport system substrate-binding protein
MYTLSTEHQSSMNQNDFDRCLEKLSKRQENILKLFLQGQNDSEIAGFITEETVRRHIFNICQKFGFKNNKDSPKCSHRDELIDLFIRYKGEWVANGVRTRLGYPKWEDPDSNRYIERTGSNFYLEQVKRCRDNAQVIKLLEKAVKGDRSNPYAQIYFNNSKARLKGSTLKIGVVVAKAGNDFHEFASMQVLRGVADAQSSFNQNGGKDGRLLEIDIRNDGNQALDAEEVAREFANDPNILAVIGHHSSEGTKAALHIYEGASMAVISPTSTSSQLRSRTFFRTIGSTKAVASKYAQYIEEELKLDKIAVFHHKNNEYSQTLKIDFEEAFRGQIIYPNQDMSDPDFEIENLLQSIIETKIKAALAISSVETNSVAITIARENHELQSQKIQLLFTTSLPEIPTLEKGGNAVEGVVLASPCLAENSDYVQQAKTRWEEPEINWRVTTSYDATQALIEAIKLSEEPTREAILQNLEGLNLSIDQTSGFGLCWSTSDYHSNAQRKHCITQISNRRFEKFPQTYNCQDP